MTNKKFAFGKSYNVTVDGEGLDINQADVEFCIKQDGYAIVIPLQHIKESVFELKIPPSLSTTISKKNDIGFSITVKKDNLCFEVMKESFDLEYFQVKNIKIEESVPETIITETETLPEVKKEEPVSKDTGSKNDELAKALLEIIKPPEKPVKKLVSKSLKDLLKKS